MQKEIKNNDRLYKTIKAILSACIPVFIFLCVSYFLQRRNIIPSDLSPITKKENTPVNVPAGKQENVTQFLEGAISSQNLELVQNFIKQGADVNAKDHLGNPYLSLACHYGSSEIVKTLIENGADVNAKKASGETPLMYARDPEIIKILKDAGAKVNTNIPLYDMVPSNNYAVLKEMIDAGADINAKDHTGATSLIMAAKGKNLNMAKFLIENGADVNVKDNEDYTPLMFNIFNRNIEITKLLIENGADVNAKTNNGSSALSFLVFTYDDPYYHYSEEETAKIAEILIKAGADTNLKGKKFNNDQEISLLYYTLSRNSKKIAKVLIEGGANVNEKGPDNVTYLMIASAKGYTDIVKLLIEKGADVNAKMSDKTTALYFAKQGNNTEIINILKQAGAKE